jgi:hypothetical protein
MKTVSHLILYATFAAAAFAGPSPTSVAPHPKLALVVNVPPSMHPFRDDNIANAIADDVAAEFQHDGYHGLIDYDYRSPGSSRSDVPRLELSLIEWRLTLTHSIECTFSANLITPNGTKNLGVFTGTSLVMGFRDDPFMLADDYDGAARDAIDDLYRMLANKNLLPAAPRPSASV